MIEFDGEVRSQIEFGGKLRKQFNQFIDGLVKLMGKSLQRVASLFVLNANFVL